LGRLAHEKFTDVAIGRLLDALRPFEASLPYESVEASLIRTCRRDYERAIKVPSRFMSEFYEHSAASYEAWAKARPANDFAAVRPMLEQTLDMSRRYAEFFPGYTHIADPLIDATDYGMQAATVRELFAALRAQLVPLVQAIAAQPVADDSCLVQHFAPEQQLAFGVQVIKRYGYDFGRGRQDLTHHPYMTKFSLGDVRITTRVDENHLSQGLFGTLHEAGHALYEQGIRRDLEGTPLASGTSAGVHESQSRLWENIVGRSRGLWQFLYPQLQAAFPAQLGRVDLDTFYRAINKVERSLIRVEADEVTYNLHVMMRFDFELALLEGSLEVRDLPDAWFERMQTDLGITPPDDRDGVMQDVHWYAGVIGGSFQGYTIGNVLSAQFYETAVRAHPRIPDEIAAGEFGTLHHWLAEHVYQYGRMFTASELVERATGGPLTLEPYLRYLRRKYGELYKL
jgi:carboxypeptidase Taq